MELKSNAYTTRLVNRGDLNEANRLVRNPRCPFYGISPEKLLELLMTCDASIDETRELKYVGGDSAEGIMLFGQHEPYPYVYITLRGSIVFFQPLPKGKTRSDAKVSVPRSGQPIDIGHLVKNFRYVHSVHEGEIGGLAGLVTETLMVLNKKSRGLSDFDVRWRAMIRAYVSDMAGIATFSAFMSRRSKVLKIPRGAFINLISTYHGWGNAVGWVDKQSGDLVSERNRESAEIEPALTRRRFLLYCCSETAVRQSQLNYNESLCIRGEYCRALSGFLYGLYKSRWSFPVAIKNAQIAWYLHLPNADSVSDLLKIPREIDERGFWRVVPPHNSNLIDIDPLVIRRYYRHELHKLNLKRRANGTGTGRRKVERDQTG